MSTDVKEQSLTKVTTGKVRLSYFKGWHPEAMEEGDDNKVYSTGIIIDREDSLTLGRINKAVDHLIAEAKKKYGGKLPAKFKLPLRDGDERPDDDAYADKHFLNAKSKNKPNIVGLEKDAKGDYKSITDEDEVYSGCYARVSLNFYLFDHPKGGKGIGVGLNNIQKVKDGDPLGGGRSKPEDDFAEEFEDDGDDFL